MTTEGRKFSISVRIDNVNPAHVRLSIFSAMILEEYDHVQATRGKAGDLVLRCEEFVPFMEQLDPHLVGLQMGVTAEQVEEYTGYVGDYS